MKLDDVCLQTQDLMALPKNAQEKSLPLTILPILPPSLPVPQLPRLCVPIPKKVSTHIQPQQEKQQAQTTQQTQQTQSLAEATCQQLPVQQQQQEQQGSSCEIPSAEVHHPTSSSSHAPNSYNAVLSSFQECVSVAQSAAAASQGLSQQASAEGSSIHCLPSLASIGLSWAGRGGCGSIVRPYSQNPFSGDWPFGNVSPIRSHSGTASDFAHTLLSYGNSLYRNSMVHNSGEGLQGNVSHSGNGLITFQGAPLQHDPFVLGQSIQNLPSSDPGVQVVGDSGFSTFCSNNCEAGGGPGRESAGWKVSVALYQGAWIERVGLGGAVGKGGKFEKGVRDDAYN
jgi:hypothetical protein